MKTFILMISMLVGAQISLATEKDCAEQFVDAIKIADQKHDYAGHMFYEKNVGAILDLNFDEFSRRLEKFNVTHEYFYEMVERFENPNERINLLRKIFNFLNPKTVIDAIKFRNITNDSFFKIYLTETTITLGFLTAAHIELHGNDRIAYFIAQFTSVMFTEMALVFASADNAAKLVADQIINKQAPLDAHRNAKEKLLKRIKNMDISIYDMLKSSAAYTGESIKVTLKKTAANFNKIAGASFMIGVIPYSIVAFENSATTGEAIETALVSLAFHTLFIGAWSNIRGAYLYGKLYPDLNRVLADKEKTLWVLYWSFVSANAYIGGQTFSGWAPNWEEGYEKLKAEVIKEDPKAEEKINQITPVQI